MRDHLTGDDFERLARGELPAPQAKQIARHLLKGCGVCGESLLPLLQRPAAEDAGPPAAAGREYDAPIARALAEAMSGNPRIRREERALVARGLGLVRNHPSGIAGLTEEEAVALRGVPWVEVLLQLSFEQRYRNPQEMLRFAVLATTAAQNIDPREHGPELAADYQARAWAELANAHRVNDELREAAAAFKTAEGYLWKGTGNLLLLARLADLRASLLNDQRLLSDAYEMLDGVYQLYRHVGDDHLAGRALVSKGIYMNYDGEPTEALKILREGLPLLDRERDPQLVISATESILEVMVQCGEFRAAAKMLLESGLRQAQADQPLNLVTLRWVEGQILAGLGKAGRAESALQEARAGFRQYRKEYKGALVGLDLAALWLGRGEQGKVKELAEDMLATFERLGIQREALRALDYLNRVCEHQRATPGLVRHVGRFLRDLERQPQLRFEAI